LAEPIGGSGSNERVELRIVIEVNFVTEGTAKLQWKKYRLVLILVWWPRQIGKFKYLCQCFFLPSPQVICPKTVQEFGTPLFFDSVNLFLNFMCCARSHSPPTLSRMVLGKSLTNLFFLVHDKTCE